MHGTASTDRDRLALRGMAMVFVATVGWSFAGLFTRALTTDICTTTAWRSFAGGMLLLIPWLLQRRTAALRDIASFRTPDWIAVVVGVIAQGATTAGLFLTSVAHVAVIYACCPFIAAVIAWVWLGEAVAGATLVAIGVSICGVITVVAGSFAGGSLIGDATALLMTMAFAIMIVLPRAYPGLRVLEIMIVSAFATFALFLPFSRLTDLDLRNSSLIAAYGSINLVVAYFLFIKGARYIPAATSGLIATLEIALSPLWVWLFMAEKVDAQTFVGGAIVASAVVGHLLVSAWQANRAGDHARSRRNHAGAAQDAKIGSDRHDAMDNRLP